jgi:hypothetical protein
MYELVQCAAFLRCRWDSLVKEEERLKQKVHETGLKFEARSLT